MYTWMSFPISYSYSAWLTSTFSEATALHSYRMGMWQLPGAGPVFNASSLPMGQVDPACNTQIEIWHLNGQPMWYQDVNTQTSRGLDDDGVTPVRSRFPRLREGIERFLITDINNPAASAQAQSDIPVMWDAYSAQLGTTGYADGAVRFNHIPGGSNVLFMDGHVEFIRLTDRKFPIGSQGFNPNSLAAQGWVNALQYLGGVG